MVLWERKEDLKICSITLRICPLFTNLNFKYRYLWVVVNYNYIATRSIFTFYLQSVSEKWSAREY